MGLDIKKYSYSYGALQRLRAAALKVENNPHSLSDVYDKDDCDTKFEALIHHSDCSGGYKSIEGKTKKTKFVEIEAYSEEWYYWGHSLEKLKAECEELNRTIRNYLPEGSEQVWQDFYDDVKSARRILEFG